MTRPKWEGYRFLVERVGDPEVNIRRDEELFTAYSAGVGRPTWRVYTWRRPAVTYGYLQNRTVKGILAAGNDIVVAGKKVGSWPTDIPVIRRPTGGGLVPHGADITYAVVRERRVGTANYEDIVEAVAEALRRLGIPAEIWRDAEFGRRGLCFNSLSPYDIHVKGKKIAGCAQRRTATAILHHGSIADSEPAKFFRDVGFWNAERSTTIKEVLGAPVGVVTFSRVLADVLGLQPVFESK